MVQQVVVTIDWPAIHAAAAAVDRVRGALGRDGVVDAFGGSYSPSYYERRGLAGLAMVAAAASSIRTAAWLAIHGASRAVREAAAVRPEDGHLAHWAVGAAGRSDVLCRSQRGARWRAARYGGRAVTLRVGVELAGLARAQRVVDLARAATATAIALHDLYAALAATGIVEYRPASEICGCTDVIGVTGLRWLAGQECEARPVSVAAARAFVDGGLDALRSAVAA